MTGFAYFIAGAGVALLAVLVLYWDELDGNATYARRLRRTVFRTKRQWSEDVIRKALQKR